MADFDELTFFRKHSTDEFVFKMAPKRQWKVRPYFDTCVVETAYIS